MGAGQGGSERAGEPRSEAVLISTQSWSATMWRPASARTRWALTGA